LSFTYQEEQVELEVLGEVQEFQVPLEKVEMEEAEDLEAY
jgi:hypothetical protein